MKDIVCSIIGHIDHGKTMFIDSILDLHLVQNEAGRITQRLQAYKLDYKDIATYFKTFKVDKIETCNILFIDTPGHASFFDIKERAIVISDIVLLFVDVIKGLEPQVLELINLLIKNNTFFIVVLTKLDLISNWKPLNTVFKDNIKLQASDALLEFDDKLSKIRKEFWKIDKDLMFYVDYVKQNNADVIPYVGISSFTKEGFSDLFLFLSYVSNSKVNSKEYIYVLDYFVDVATKYVLLVKNTEIKVNQVFKTANSEIKIKKMFLSPYYKPEYVTKFKGTDIISCEVNCKFPLKIGDYIGSYNAITHKAFGIIIKASSLGSLEGLVTTLRNNNIEILQASVGDITKKDILLTENNISKYNKIIINYNLPLKKFKTSAHVISEKTIYDVLKRISEYHKKLDTLLLESIKKQVKHFAYIKFLKQYVINSEKPYILGFEFMSGQIAPNYELIDCNSNKLKIVSLQINNKDVVQIKDSKLKFASKVMCDIAINKLEEDWFTDLSIYLTDLNKISYLLDNNEKEVLKKNNEKSNSD